jgi:hypothetical protein
MITVADPSPLITVIADGVAGGCTPGVIGAAVATGPRPAALPAETEIVYDVPGVRPVITHVVAGAATVHDAPPGKAAAS